MLDGREFLAIEIAALLCLLKLKLQWALSSICSLQLSLQLCNLISLNFNLLQIFRVLNN